MVKFRSWWLVGGLCLGALLSPRASDAVPLQPVTLRGVGMGEAMRSIGGSNDGLFFNPATVAVGRRFQADIAYGYHHPRVENIASLSVVDSKSGPVALGLAHTRLLGNNPAYGIGQRNYMAIGGMLQETLAIAVGVQHLAGQGLAEKGWDSLRNINMDVGLVLRLANLLQLGATAQNLLPTGYRVGFPATFAGGASLQLAILTLAYDVAYMRDLGAEQGPKWSHYAGGELLLLDSFALRGGWSYQQPHWSRATASHGMVSTGVAAYSQSGSIQLAYQQSLGLPKAAYRILASLAFFL